MDCVQKEYYRTRSFSQSGGKAKVTACGVEFERERDRWAVFRYPNSSGWLVTVFAYPRA
jgi:hypothetical protein